MQRLQRARLSSIFVRLAGGLGLAAIQIAKAAGALAIGTAGSAQKRAYLRDMKAHAAINSRTTEFATDLACWHTIRRPQAVLNSLTSPGEPQHAISQDWHIRVLPRGKQALTWSA